MSLHKFAQEVASKGRGDDSLLIHMTPDEVRNLQQFAQANGTTLTINPTTGLPEAGLLSDLFKAVAPIALGAFLGPAGLGMSSMMAGVATGGITTLATGSLSRGLMAGLGAYGGAGLGESFMTAGGNAMVAGGAPVGAENLVGGLSSSGATAGSAVSVPPIEQINPSNFNLAKTDVLSAGAKAAAANPMAFAKQNLGNLAYAAAPIAAGLMVPTTTKLPDPKDTGYIRQFDYNINPDTGKPDPLYGMRAMTPVKASEFGNKTFQGQRDLFRQQNPNPYDIGIGSLNRAPQQPTPMAGGGIVALAGGGDYTTLTKDSSAEDIASAYKQFTTASGGDTAANQKAAVDYLTNLGIGQDKIGQAYGTYQASPTYTAYTEDQMGSFLSNPVNKDIDLGKAIKDTNADPAAVNRYIASLTSPFVGSTESDRGSGTFGIYNQMVDKSISPDEYYKAALASNPAYKGWTKDMIQEGYNLNKGMYALSDAKKGVVTDTDWAKLMVGNGSWDKPQYDVNEMAQATGLSIAEVRARYELEKLKANPIIKTVNTFTGTGGTGTGAVTGGTGTGGTGGTGGTSVIPGGFYGNATNPGDITTNKDGTVTVHPNIPYRPYGGFSGIEEVSNAYTKGGGSLGYKAAVPKTPAEHAAAYNTMTDDSLDAYNFLMGKGKNLTQRKAETRNRPVMQRYDEAVLGRKIGKPVAKTTTTTKSVVGVPGNPQTYFDEKAYLAANPDVEAEMKSGKSNFTSAYEHWLRYGKAEGRKFMGDYEGYTTAAALAEAAGAGGGGPGNDGGGGVGGTGGGGSGGNAAGAASAAGGGSSAPGTSGNSASAAAAAAAAAASVGEGNADASGGKRGGQVIGYAMGGGLGSLGSYSDGGRLLRGPGDGVSDSIPATIGRKQQPARLADGEFVIPARIVSELGNGSTDAGAKKLYAMMDRVQRARGKTTGKNKVAANSRADKYLPA
jgi:hypothetical protein